MILVMLLGFVFAVPVFHAHYNEGLVEHTEKEIESEIKKCPICTILTHYQHEKYLISGRQLLTAPVRTFTVKLPEVILGIYIFTLQGLTNKGPPLFQKLAIGLV
ncbi:MAG: hypothetical protein WKF66_09035 [Pedobacter sp.]